MTSTSALKDCPFCGSSDLEINTTISDGVSFILCVGCKASSGDFDSQTKATKAWNKRSKQS